MKKNLVSLVAVLVLSLTVSAGAKTKRYGIDLSKPVEVNGVQLKSGSYQVAAVDDSVVFYQGNKEVAKVPARTEELGAKNHLTSVTVDTQRGTITELRLAGTTTKLLLEDTANASPTGGEAPSPQQ